MKEGEFMQYKRIKELREDKDLTQSDLAKILNTTQANYSYIENGVAYLKADELVKLCMYYNVSADYILGLPKNMDYPER